MPAKRGAAARTREGTLVETSLADYAQPYSASEAEEGYDACAQHLMKVNKGVDGVFFFQFHQKTAQPQHSFVFVFDIHAEHDEILGRIHK